MSDDAKDNHASAVYSKPTTSSFSNTRITADSETTSTTHITDTNPIEIDTDPKDKEFNVADIYINTKKHMLYILCHNFGLIALDIADIENKYHVTYLPNAEYQV